MKQQIVIDLEMCNAPKPNGEHKGYRGSEIIQIGAVKLDENYDVIDSYKAFVCPEYTMISPRILELTGIRQGDVDKASKLQESMESFFTWIGEGECTFISWSDCDEIQLSSEYRKKEMVEPRLEQTLGKWVDCQQIFGERINQKRLYNLEQALIISDISYKDGAHDALIDAHNTALLYKKLKSKGEFKFNKYYCEEEEHLAFGLGSLFANVEIDES